MSLAGPARDVQLLDARVASRPLVPAKLYRDYPLPLEEIERLWGWARDKAALAASQDGLEPLEHGH
jgi:hypothetical protein